MTRTQEQRELAADVELLYTDYCESLDDADTDRWPGFFTQECSYRITTRENVDRGLPLCFVLCEGQAMLRDRAAALQRTVFHRRRFQRRIVSGLRLKTFEGLDRDGIEACASFVVYESVGDEPSRLLACGRSTDVIVRDGGALRFKHRLCVIDARVMPDSLVFPL
jgi:3-phenylpropionate/cinnamic acid dioxygenase small subunit